MQTNSQTVGTDEVVDWTDLGREMWSFLTGRQAAINYRFGKYCRGSTGLPL